MNEEDKRKGRLRAFEVMKKRDATQRERRPV